MLRDLIIIGGGPAGYTASLYASRANLKPLHFEGAQAGGQLTTTTLVENYPGFPEGIQGPELVRLIREQANHFGAEIISENVSMIDLSKRPFRVQADSGIFEAKTVIISTGARARTLGLPSEKKLWGKGVSTCATCDGFFFRGKEVAVIGGGDSAMEESLFLSQVVKKVTVIHRGETLRASQIMQERAKANPKISFLWNTEVKEVLGDTRVTGLRLHDTKEDTETELALDGMFLAIGHEPASEFMKDQLELDIKNYIKVFNETTATSVKGVFACGDVVDHRYRQAVTAAGTGCMAALDAERFLMHGKE